MMGIPSVTMKTRFAPCSNRRTLPIPSRSVVKTRQDRHTTKSITTGEYYSSTINSCRNGVVAWCSSNYALKLKKWPQGSRATGRRFHHAPANWVIPSSWQYCSLVTYYYCIRYSLSSRASAFEPRTTDSPHIATSTCIIVFAPCHHIKTRATAAT